MTHTATYTGKCTGGSNGTDRANVRNMPDEKAPKALKTVKRSTRIHFVISRLCVRVTPPAPKSIESFGFRCFFVAKMLVLLSADIIVTKFYLFCSARNIDTNVQQVQRKK